MRGSGCFKYGTMGRWAHVGKSQRSPHACARLRLRSRNLRSHRALLKIGENKGYFMFLADSHGIQLSGVPPVPWSHDRMLGYHPACSGGPGHGHSAPPVDTGNPRRPSRLAGAARRLQRRGEAGGGCNAVPLARDQDGVRGAGPRTTLRHGAKPQRPGMPPDRRVHSGETNPAGNRRKEKISCFFSDLDGSLVQPL